MLILQAKLQHSRELSTFILSRSFYRLKAAKGRFRTDFPILSLQVFR